MNIRTRLETIISQALADAGALNNAPAVVKTSSRPEFGDYQANGIMGAAKALKMNPREFAAKVLENLDLSTYADKLEIAGPGFINIHLKNEWLGEQVEKTLSLQQQEDEITLQLADLEKFYQAAKIRFDEDAEFAKQARENVVKLQAGDPEFLALWKQFIDTSLNHCDEIYQILNVLLTREDVMPESAYNDDLANVISDLKEKGLLTEDQGAQCVFLEEFKGKDDSIIPMIVQKSDGGYLYATTDLAALRYRND
ncbi:Arginine--tRNA ligase [Nymphon striatum]|nr:Arginine--tRNA ligase [Nymphon striatum]